MPGADPTGGSGAAPSYLTAMGLNTDQALFDQELSAKTGLSQTAIAAWELAEENGSAATSYHDEGFEDWLNIGVTGSAPGKTFAGFHSGPIVAADDTAEWMKGTLPSSAVTEGTGVGAKILASASGSAASQVTAIGASGWGTSATTIASTFAAANKFTPANSIPIVTPAINAGGAVAGAVSGAVNSVSSTLTGPVQEVGDIWSAVTNPSNWLRALEIFGAVVAIYLAMKSLTGQDPAAVVNTAAAAAPKKHRVREAVKTAAEDAPEAAA